MKKIIFLDRDGVINVDPSRFGELYVRKWSYFRFIKGSRRAIRKLAQNGYDVFIISNQAGIARKIFTQKDLNRITRRMLEEIRKSGGRIKRVLYCPHRSDDNCSCRKPETGMFKKAAKGLRVDFSKAFFIGDGRFDIEAGHRLGCKTILVLSGKSSRKDAGGWLYKPDYIKKDLLTALKDIVIASAEPIQTSGVCMRAYRPQRSVWALRNDVS